MKDAMHRRLNRLHEWIDLHTAGGFDSSPSVSDALRQPDNERLAEYLAAAHRAGLLDTEPSSDDESQFAQFVRIARRVLALTSSH